MKRSLLVLGVVAAMLVTASSVLAAGVNLAWNACATLGGVTDKTFACAVNTGTNLLEGTFVLPNDVAQVSAAEVVIDLDSQQASLPSWWALKFLGACRANSLTIQAYNGDGVDCVDWAQGLASMNVASYAISGQDIPPGGLGPNTARIKIVNAVDPTALQDLIGNTEYAAFQLTINNQKTVGLGSCAGCSNPVCIVFNSCLMTTSENLNNTFMGTGTSAGSNIVTWQGAGADCQAVPVRNASWGQVKALYR